MILEVKQGKQIEGSCRSLWSNKDRCCINGINSRRKEVDAFTHTLHHRSNAYARPSRD